MSKSQEITTTPGRKISPISKDDWLQMGLRQAGIKPEELAETVRDAFNENKRLLQAVKKTTKVIDGLSVTTECEDNPVRQKAIDSIFNIAGIRSQRQESTGPSRPVINMYLPGYYSKEFLTQEGTVIDIEEEEE